MSMNLHATCNGKPIELYQTPTYITRMVLVSSEGAVASLKGKKARRALNSYIEWVLDPGYLVFNSNAEHMDWLEICNHHIEEVRKFLDCPDLEVFGL